MSISPSGSNRSATLSSGTLPRNPSSSHGSSPSPPPQGPRRPPNAPIDGAAARSAAEILVPALSSTETAIGVTGDPSRLCEQVTNSTTVSCTGPIVQGGLSSQFGGNLSAPAQVNGISSGSSSYLQSDRIAAGSGSSQGFSTQPTGKRNYSVNANHLLNFHYDPISRSQASRTPPPPRRQRKVKPYNKDLFLQANFKFVVLESGSYLSETKDPDRMLQWEDVICVRYSTPSPVQCPICLETPLCPQITTCGHVYCFPCILRYLLMGDEDHKGECWKKCPLCFTMICSKDLYTIQIENVKQFHVGDVVHFTLLTRAKDSLVPSLKYREGADHTLDTSNTLADTFAKFILTSDVDLSAREAKLDLSNWLEKAESGLVDDLEKLPYVCAALEQLEERMKSWREHQNMSSSPPAGNSAPSNIKAAHTAKKLESPASNSCEEVKNAISDAWESEGGTMHAGQKHDKSASSEKSYIEDVELFSSVPAKEQDSYTYYQAIDGQHLILHPINMKCLLHHYGSYDMLPPRISGVILELENVTQSEAIRKRYRYLSHFSLTTTFQLCEIDLNEFLPPHSFAPFLDEIKKREKQRKQLARKERAEKARAEAAAFHAIPIPSNGWHSSHNDPVFSPDDFEVLGSGLPSTSPPVVSGRALFSNVTRLGFAAAHDSPSLKAEGSANSSGTKEETGETSRVQEPRNKNMSFASIIATAKTPESREPQQAAGFGKKGKKPAKVLLSTAGGRRY